MERGKSASGLTTTSVRQSTCIRWFRIILNCIRYTGADPDSARSRELHARVAQRVEQSGKFWISTTELKGKSWFRINPVNFRTRKEHMDELFQMLQHECRAVAQSLIRI